MVKSEKNQFNFLFTKKGATTPLQQACIKHHYSPGLRNVRVLLQAKADPNLVGSKLSDPPVLLAIREGSSEAMHLLIEAKANLNANFGGETLLHKAVREIRADLVKLLLKTKAQTLRNSAGLTPLELISKLQRTGTQEKFSEIAELLRIAESRQRSVAFLTCPHPRQTSGALYRATRSGIFDRNVFRIILDMAGVETTKRSDIPRESPEPS